MFSLLDTLVLALALLLPQAAPTPAPPQTSAPAAAPAPVEDPTVTALARKIYTQMRAGKIDGSLMTKQMNEGLTPAVLAEKKPIFDQLGEPTKLTLQQAEKLSQGTRYTYLAEFAAAQLHVKIFIDNEGKVAGYFLAP
jgi:3-oxoacyl-ACP reductase-like protein